MNPAGSIPEVGVGGCTDSHGDVFISIDDTPRGGLRAALSTWIPATVAHELHHSSRTRTGPGYGTTLGDALVSASTRVILEPYARPAKAHKHS